MKKRITFLIILLAVITVVSGCQKGIENNELEIKGRGNQEQNQEQENQNQEETIPKEEIKYLDNGEIDTSGWKTYGNELYKMEIKYPPFLMMYADSKDDGFTMSSYWEKETQTRIDKNWDIQFTKTLLDFQKLPLEEKRRRFMYKDQRNSSFEIIELEGGFIFYQNSLSLAGYVPGAQIYSKNNILVGSIYIYSDDLNFSNYDPKYINIFKAILKTIKFDE